MKKIIIPESDQNAIIAMYEQGHTGREIATKFYLTQWVIDGVLKENSVLRRESKDYRKIAVNKNYFKVIDTHEKAYVLGLFFSDGCVTGGRYASITLLNEDKETLAQVANAMEYDGLIREYNNGTICRYSICCKEICDDLIKLGCVPAKSLILKYPNINPEFNSSFTLGLFDGDGSISKARGDITLAGSKDICENVVKIWGQLAKKVSIGKAYQSYDVLTWMYAKSPIRMKRKYDIYSKIDPNVLDRKRKIDALHEHPENIISEYQQNKNLRALSIKYSIDSSTVSAILNENGVECSRKFKNR